MHVRRAAYIVVLGAFFLLDTGDTRDTSAGNAIGVGLFTPADHARLERLIEEMRACREVAGIVVSVVSGNETLLAKGYGEAVVETRTPATSSSHVCVASLTKAFTATLLGQLLPKHK